MKQYYQITKIGNSLFATLSSKLVRQLGLKSGDQVFYELVPGKKKVMMNIVPQGTIATKEDTSTILPKADKKWLEETAGSLSVR